MKARSQEGGGPKTAESGSSSENPDTCYLRRASRRARIEAEHSESLAERRSELRRLDSESENLDKIKEILKFHGTKPKGFFPARRAGQEMVFSPEQWRITCEVTRS